MPLGEVTGYRYTPASGFGAFGKNATISFTGVDSKKVEFEVYDHEIYIIKPLFELIDKYSTKDDKEINPKELVNLRVGFERIVTPESNGRHGVIDWYKGFEFLLNTRIHPQSDGGENITVAEIASMFESMKTWIVDKHKRG